MMKTGSALTATILAATFASPIPERAGRSLFGRRCGVPGGPVPKKRLEFLPRIVLLGLCGTQLTACIAAYPRDGVPTGYMAEAEVSGYSSDIRVWGDSDASFPADRLISFRDERLKAAKTDPSIKLRKLDALTLSGGGSSGAFGAGILAGWAKAGTRPKFDIVTGISAGALIAPFAFLGPA